MWDGYIVLPFVLLGSIICTRLLADHDWSPRWCQDNRWLPSAPVLRWFHQKAHQPDQKDFVCSAPAGPSDPQEDDGDYVPWGSDQRSEGGCQQAVSYSPSWGHFTVTSLISLKNFYNVFFFFHPVSQTVLARTLRRPVSPSTLCTMSTSARSRCLKSPSLSVSKKKLHIFTIYWEHVMRPVLVPYDPVITVFGVSWRSLTLLNIVLS